MLISLIAAMAQNRCIGKDGQLPWSLPADLQRFKQLTMGHSLLMGRKTFESIGRALPGRSSYVLSHDPHYSAPGCRVVAGIDEAVAQAEAAGETELFICGGEEVYRQAMPRCRRIYLTELERGVSGDAFFPEIPQHEFRVIRTLQIEDREPCRFTLFERNANSLPRQGVQV